MKWDEENFVKMIPQMSTETVQLIVEQAEDGHLKKEDVGRALLTKNMKNKPSFSILSRPKQLEIFRWNQEATLEHLHLLSEEDILWLVRESTENKWNQASVAEVMIKSNRISSLSDLRQEVFLWNTKAVSDNIFFLTKSDISWVLQQVREDNQEVRWKKNNVYAGFGSRGRSSFSKLNGREWLCVDSLNTQESSIRHNLYNAKLAQALVQWQSTLGEPEQSSVREINGLMEAGGLKIDFRSVNEEQRDFLRTSVEAWNSKNDWKCKLFLFLMKYFAFR